MGKPLSSCSLCEATYVGAQQRRIVREPGVCQGDDQHVGRLCQRGMSPVQQQPAFTRLGANTYVLLLQ